MVESWPKFALKELPQRVELARTQNKYVFINDLQGNCDSYFKVSGRIKAQFLEFGRIMTSAEGVQEEIDDGIEMLRAKWVVSMRLGQPLVLNMQKSEVCFASYAAHPLFPCEVLFDSEQGRKPENYLKIVKEEENRDIFGNERFEMKPEFMLIVLSTHTSDEKAEAMFNSLPSSEKFEKFVIQ